MWETQSLCAGLGWMQEETPTDEWSSFGFCTLQRSSEEIESGLERVLVLMVKKLPWPKSQKVLLQFLKKRSPSTYAECQQAQGEKGQALLCSLGLVFSGEDHKQRRSTWLEQTQFSCREEGCQELLDMHISQIQIHTTKETLISFKDCMACDLDILC